MRDEMSAADSSGASDGSDESNKSNGSAADASAVDGADGAAEGAALSGAATSGDGVTVQAAVSVNRQIIRPILPLNAHLSRPGLRPIYYAQRTRRPIRQAHPFDASILPRVPRVSYNKWVTNKNKYVTSPLRRWEHGRAVRGVSAAQRLGALTRRRTRYIL